MTISPLRSTFCYMLAILLPVSTLFAQTTPAGGAIVNTNGGIVAVNGNLVKDSSAVGDNDTISTGPESVAHITSAGSNTVLASDTVAAFSHDAIRLTTGAVSIATSGGMYTQVHKLKFAPVNQGTLTKYEVRVEGCSVTVTARTGAVALPSGKVLAQGDSDRSSDKECEKLAKIDPRPPAAAISGLGPLAWGLIAGGGAAAGATAGYVALQSGGKAPLSPAAP